VRRRDSRPDRAARLLGRRGLKLTDRLRRGQTGAQHPEPHLDDRLTHAGERDLSIVREAMPYTMTGGPRLLALIDATRHVIEQSIPGDFAECGVWRGGSVLAMIRTLQQLDAPPRDIHLYDTFEGMTQPTTVDNAHDEQALESWNDAKTQGRHPWAHAFAPEIFGEQQVRRTLHNTAYPEDRLHIVKGPVETTIPDHAPAQLALLRLDTDWYESTRHELIHLYPRLHPGGVLIVDDYGHWEGARKAVDEYFSQGEHPRPLLHRIDYTCRIAVKPQ
jgi:hypothetical protein